nr:Spy/CpxP family protein refolding chaperone [Pollutimonas harenae]
MPAVAQHHVHSDGHHAASAEHSPYAGMQSRPIKALSEQQINGLRSGKGMAMAMPAELNGYPGPLHVLELAPKIKLSDDQVALTKKLYSEMQAEAKAAGEKVIEAERELDSLFAHKKASAETVAVAVSRAANEQGKLREIHLRYHLRMIDALTPEQIASYNKLRGY